MDLLYLDPKLRIVGKPIKYMEKKTTESLIKLHTAINNHKGN